MIEDTLYFHNPWWSQKNVPPEFLPHFERPILNLLEHYIEKLERIVVIKGPRRTGKTTLLYQTINWLIQEKGINPYSLIYLSFDDLQLRLELEKILAVYEKIRKKTLKETQTYIFLDEVHFLEGWQFVVKKYFDKKFPIKFLISSSSASLFKKGVESLAGRTIEEPVLPFDFREYASFYFKDKSNAFEFLKKGDLAPIRQELAILFESYLKKGGFPNLLEIEEEHLWKRLLRDDCLDKVIYRDLVQLYGVREPAKLESFFLYLAGINGGLLNLSKASSVLELSRQNLSNYFSYFKEAFLVFEVKRFSLSAGKKLRATSKIYLVDSGLGYLFGGSGRADFILEGLAARVLQQDGEICYYSDHNEIDFVLKREGKLYPVEVKNKPMPESSDFKSIFNFMRRFNIKEGLLLCQDFEGEEKREDFRIKVQPIREWLVLR